MGQSCFIRIAPTNGGGNLRPGAAVLSLPARRPYQFWIPSVFVLIVGFSLALSNYFREPAALEPSNSSVPDDAAAVTDSQSDLERSAVMPPTRARSRFQRFCISMAVVLVASLVAGFSIAQLLDRPPVGFRNFEQAEQALPMPVLGAVPIDYLPTSH